MAALAKLLLDRNKLNKRLGVVVRISSEMATWYALVNNLSSQRKSYSQGFISYAIFRARRFAQCRCEITGRFSFYTPRY
jgi:hypothetical protein